MADGGKGALPRPIPNRKEYESNWDAIFGKNKQKENHESKEDNETQATDSNNS